MNTGKSPLKVAFLSTYPPRECGIATFTRDLIRGLRKTHRVAPCVIALSDDAYTYGDTVILDVRRHDTESYKQAARAVNASGCDVLVVEHEYGLFGGEHGENLLAFLEPLALPVVSTLHTVLPDPQDKQKTILQVLCKKSSAVVTMSHSSRKILEQKYLVASEKVQVIHHGVPEFNGFADRRTLKKEMGWEDRTIVSTFGLIGPGKGLEYGIEAIETVAHSHPEILYLILGQTHPVLKRQYGEGYRKKLEDLVSSRALEHNVRFVNRYLSLRDVIRYLLLSDIYMTPYLERNQAVSGTLAYAVGCGRAIVSTPYPYAKEMLADGRGMLAEFADTASLAQRLSHLIDYPDERAHMEQRTSALGQTMSWPMVGEQYASLFEQVVARVEGVSKS